MNAVDLLDVTSVYYGCRSVIWEIESVAHSVLTFRTRPYKTVMSCFASLHLRTKMRLFVLSIGTILAQVSIWRQYRNL